MGYRFFDYKYNIHGFKSDLFSTPHIVYIVLVYIFAFVISYLLRKTKHEKISVGIKILSIVMFLLEIGKISFEGYYDVTTGRGFNYEGILPVYTCSLFMYALFCAGFFKGFVRKCCLSFITTIGLLYGAIGVVYCNGLNFYPFWTFGAFYSLFFHSAMFITGVFLLMTGYKKLEWKDSLLAMIPILVLALVAIPINYHFKGAADYMLIYSGGGVPLYEDLAKKLAEKGLRWVYTIIMLVTHIPLALVVIGVYKLIAKLAAAKKK